VVGGARACALRVAVRCEARVEVGTRGLAAGRARASFAMGLRIFHRESNKGITLSTVAPTAASNAAPCSSRNVITDA
jgi:hypothetical protein